MKLIDGNQNSSVMIGPADQLNGTDPLKSNGEATPVPRDDRSSSSHRRAFALYPNGLSDWDSTDSESGANETHVNDEPTTSPPPAS